MLIILYNIFFLVFFLPVILVKMFASRNEHRVVLERLGAPLVKALAGKPLWVHALSVGEVLSSVPLIKKLLEADSGRPVVLSVSTATGHEIAQRLLSKDVALIFWLPYDLIWFVRRAIRSVRPLIFLLVETDIWPNVVYEMKRRAVPFILVNGRISPRSFAGYKHLSFLMRYVFSNMASICAQTKSDADRFVALGASPERVRVTGNMKFDQIFESLSDVDGRSLRSSMGIAPKVKVFMAGSTHEGEEVILLHCFRTLKRDFPDLVLVLVPRDPGRAKSIRTMFDRAGFFALLKTDLEKCGFPGGSDVIIVDTIGDLRQLYAIADVVFVGKSLANLGGQNPLEPAALKRPILFGPHMFNFELIAEQLVREGGALRVADEKELCYQANALLADSERSKDMGLKAYGVFQTNRGAVDKTLRVINRFV